MMSDVSLYFIGFLINFMVAFALVRWIYYPSSPVKSHVFTFLAFNTIIYFVISILPWWIGISSRSIRRYSSILK